MRDCGTKNWTLTEEELSDMIMSIMVEAKTVVAAAEQYAEEVIIKECVGQRLGENGSVCRGG